MSAVLLALALLAPQKPIGSGWLPIYDRQIRIAGQVGVGNLVVLRKLSGKPRSCSFWIAEFKDVRVRLLHCFERKGLLESSWCDRFFLIGKKLVALMDERVYVCDFGKPALTSVKLAGDTDTAPVGFQGALIGTLNGKTGMDLYVVSPTATRIGQAPGVLHTLYRVPGLLVWFIDREGPAHYSKSLPVLKNGKWSFDEDPIKPPRAPPGWIPVDNTVQVDGQIGSTDMYVVRTRTPETSLCSLWIARYRDLNLKLLAQLAPEFDWGMPINDQFFLIGSRFVATIPSSPNSEMQTLFLCDFRKKEIKIQTVGVCAYGPPNPFQGSVVGCDGRARVRKNVFDLPPALYVITSTSIENQWVPRGLTRVTAVPGGLLYGFSNGRRSRMATRPPRFSHDRWKLGH